MLNALLLNPLTLNLERHINLKALTCITKFQTLIYVIIKLYLYHNPFHKQPTTKPHPYKPQKTHQNPLGRKSMRETSAKVKVSSHSLVWTTNGLFLLKIYRNLTPRSDYLKPSQPYTIIHPFQNLFQNQNTSKSLPIAPSTTLDHQIKWLDLRMTWFYHEYVGNLFQGLTIAIKKHIVKAFLGPRSPNTEFSMLISKFRTILGFKPTSLPYLIVWVISLWLRLFFLFLLLIVFNYIIIF